MRRILLALALFLVASIPASATITYVTSATQQANNASISATSGDLLVVLYYNTGTATGISDTASNTWHAVSNAPSSVFSWWAIANATGSTTVTVAGTFSNGQFIVAEYSGSNATGFFYTGASETFALNQTSVSVGPGTLSLGALTLILTFQQATGYSSSAGSTSRLFTSGSRTGFADNLTASGSYTEQGTITGSMQFGGAAYLFGFGSAPVSSASQFGVSLPGP